MYPFASTPSAGFDPLILLLVAMVVEAYVGEARLLFRFVPHPVAVVGDLIGFLDRRLNREKRSQMDRAVRGLIAVAAVVATTGAVGWGVGWLSVNHPFGWIVELFGLVTLLAARGLYDSVKRVKAGLRENLDAGREAVSHIVGRDPLQLDAHGVARAAIESLAENFSDAVVGPVFWYVLFGFPGLLVYKAVNTMDSMIGHRTPKYRAFGMAAARLDDILNLVPARLAGLMISAAALFAAGANPKRALATMWRDAAKHRSMNAGWPEAAMAGALGLALAGPRRYAAEVVQDAWMGDGRARATPGDVAKALYLYAVACLINAGIVAALAVAMMTP